MTIAAQLELIRTKLREWGADNRAVVNIAADLDDMLAQLQATPAAARCLLHFNGETKRGEFEESAMVDRTFWLAVARGKGLRAEPGANLVTGQAGGRPLFDLVEEVRDVVRGISFESETTEVIADYKGAEPITLNGVTFTDVQRLTFTLGTLLPAPTGNPIVPVEP